MKNESPKSHTTRQTSTGPKVDPGDSGATVGGYDASVTNKMLQERQDEINAVGFQGYNPDPTPNEHYTVSGVLAGKPIPETHDMREAIQARADEATRLTAVDADNDGTVPGGNKPAKVK